MSKIPINERSQMASKIGFIEGFIEGVLMVGDLPISAHNAGIKALKECENIFNILNPEENEQTS